MTSKVQELIKQGEGLTIDFKDSLILRNPLKLAKTMVAFANAKGGMILIGVTNKGKIEGMTAKSEDQDYIMNVASDRCDPPIRPLFETSHNDAGDVYIVTVPKGRYLHGVKIKGAPAFFIRVGSTIRGLKTEELINKIILDRLEPTSPKIVELTEPKVTIDLGYHGIQNMFQDQEGKIGSSQVYGYLSVSNAGNEPIGVTKILVRSKDPHYLIWISSYEAYKGNWKDHPIRSFRLEPQESKEIILFCEGNPTISMNKKFVEAEIEIYDVNYRVMKAIPVKLHISSQYGGF